MYQKGVHQKGSGSRQVGTDMDCPAAGLSEATPRPPPPPPPCPQAPCVGAPFGARRGGAAGLDASAGPAPAERKDTATRPSTDPSANVVVYAGSNQGRGPTTPTRHACHGGVGVGASQDHAAPCLGFRVSRLTCGNCGGRVSKKRSSSTRVVSFSSSGAYASTPDASSSGKPRAGSCRENFIRFRAGGSAKGGSGGGNGGGEVRGGRWVGGWGGCQSRGGAGGPMVVGRGWCVEGRWVGGVGPPNTHIGACVQRCTTMAKARGGGDRARAANSAHWR